MANNNYVGCYYNWYTATAGAYIGNTSNEQVTPGTSGWKDVDSSICPKNWYLPTGGTDRSDSDFQILNDHYKTAAEMLVYKPEGTTYDKIYDNTTGKPTPGFLLSGIYYSGGPDRIGRSGYYWSRSAWSKGTASPFALTSSAVYLQNLDSKYSAFSVRCLAYGS